MAKRSYVSKLDLGAQLASGSGPVAGADEATVAETHAASALGAELVSLARERALSRTWRAQSIADKRQVAVVVVGEAATAAERALFAQMAEAIHAAGDALPGVLRVRAVAPSRDAFLTDLWTTGSARDLAALKWPPRRRVEFVLRMVRTLRALHARGLLHGALCPPNVLLDDDLGPIVAEAGQVPVHALLERGGGASPYVAFAAPEVIKGGTVDARSDIYSVGRILADLTRGDELPMALREIVRRCTASDPTARFASADELASALEGVLVLLSDADPASLPSPSTASGRPSARLSLPSMRPVAGRTPVPPKRGASSGWAAPRWLGVLGLVALLASAAVAVLFGGSNDVLRSVLTVGLVAGVALATTLPRLAASWPFGPAVAAQLTLALAGGAVVLALDPLPRVYRVAAQRHLRGDPASRRAAIAELLRLGRDFRGVSLAGVDLSGEDLSRADLRQVDLSHADLSRARLTAAQVQGATFDGASLAGAALDQVELGAANVGTASCDAATQLPGGWRCGEGRVERVAQGR